jgi:histidine ammonia-lyase
MKNIEIDPGEMARKSRDFLREHAAGLGNPLERTAVRGAMAILARQLLNGYSGVSPDVISLLVEILNRDIVPIVPRYGSLGASGDLAPTFNSIVDHPGKTQIELGHLTKGLLSIL